MSIEEIIVIVGALVALTFTHISTYYIGKTDAYYDIARKRREIRGGRS